MAPCNFCPSCGQKQVDNGFQWQFCPNCGRKITLDSAADHDDVPDDVTTDNMASNANEDGEDGEPMDPALQSPIKSKIQKCNICSYTPNQIISWRLSSVSFVKR